MEFDGVLNINKPADWTSQDVCAKLRGRLRIKKLGHAGTLDPMATGVLPVCVGKATRIIEYYDKDSKSYHARMQLGLETDTLDITGEVLKRNDWSTVTEAEIRKAFAAYIGLIEQIPPKYSAIQIDGRRAYDLAREGKEVNIKARKIEIHSNDITALDLTAGTVEFDVSCSKGTYIRTICDDIGRELGCGACMTELTRTSNGCFALAEAVELADVIEMSDEEIMAIVTPMEETLVSLGRIVLNDNRAIPFGNGHPSSSRCYRIKSQGRYEAMYKVFSYSGQFLGIGEIVEDELIPRKVIFDR